MITGLQLFVILHDVEETPSRAAHWRKKILETRGVMTDVPPWDTIIHEELTSE